MTRRCCLAIAAMTGLLAACGDGTAPIDGSQALLPIVVDVSGMVTADQVTVDVTGMGIDPPLVFNLTISGGRASGTLTIPTGSARTITIRVFDAAGMETHRGSTELDIREGTNPGVTVTLVPLVGEQPVTALLGDIFVAVTPAFVQIALGKKLQLTAHVTDAEGSPVDVPVQWASFNQSCARVDSVGLVTPVALGDVEIVAVAAGAAGSAKLEIITQPDFLEALIGSTFRKWSRVLEYDGPSMFLSATSFEHSAPWANAGMEYYARIPRVPSGNDPAHSDYSNLVNAWRRSYEALDAVHDGLREIVDDTLDLGMAGLRMQAFGKYIQGLAHGTVALLYDSGFVYDETTDPETMGLRGYSDVMAAALGYFADAVDLAVQLGGSGLSIPATWMSREVTPSELVQLAHSEMARMRANVARTPAERAAVDWNQVVADVNAGVTYDWELVSDCVTFCDNGLYYRNYPGWTMMPMWIIGMADQSGAYQAWINTPTIDKREFIMVTPDTRFPHGTDEATQIANPGSWFEIAEGDERLIGTRPDRGTWRWSYYKNYTFQTAAENFQGAIPLITVREMKALIAEADYRNGDMAAVAAFVNETRTLHGLQATDVAGTNADCVPKLPNGTCGDLWEMFKWEKRIEVQFRGPIRVGWYFDGRGWGDLMEGTLLQFPVPYSEMQLLGQTPYNYGGVGGEWGAPLGTYGY